MGVKDIWKSKVNEYYAKDLKGSVDLKTGACCADSPADYLKPMLAKVHDEVVSKFYGCGSPLPVVLEGKTVLDLGCGTGRDVVLAAALVGPEGRVIGLDMTDEQLEVANRHKAYHCEIFGLPEDVVEFRKGQIEDLSFLKDNSVDVVISNCVVNLSASKKQVLSEVFRVLKPGGEFFFSDVFSDRRMSPEVVEDKVLLGECLAGALYEHDFRRMVQSLGVLDIREVKRSEIPLYDSSVISKLGNVKFTSITYRIWNLSSLEDLCEDYGQAVRYNGGVNVSPWVFELDAGHHFEASRITPVCRNTFNMLKETRFAPYFDFLGDDSVHLGKFADCSTGVLEEDCGC
ncbi:methyltransferase domain-containing protein [bacterium]|nr:methyltransferase domain-containing protein [bacterium]